MSKARCPPPHVVNERSRAIGVAQACSSALRARALCRDLEDHSHNVGVTPLLITVLFAGQDSFSKLFTPNIHVHRLHPKPSFCCCSTQLVHFLCTKAIHESPVSRHEQFPTWPCQIASLNCITTAPTGQVNVAQVLASCTCPIDSTRFPTHH